jgi:hypothetical protein
MEAPSAVKDETIYIIKFLRRISRGGHQARRRKEGKNLSPRRPYMVRLIRI